MFFSESVVRGVRSSDTSNLFSPIDNSHLFQLTLSSSDIEDIIDCAELSLHESSLLALNTPFSGRISYINIESLYILLNALSMISLKSQETGNTYNFGGTIPSDFWVYVIYLRLLTEDL